MNKSPPKLKFQQIVFWSSLVTLSLGDKCNYILSRCLLEKDPIAQRHVARIQKLRGTYDSMGNRVPPPPQILAEAKERSHKRGRKKASEKRNFLSKILTLLYSWIPTADFEYNKFQKKWQASKSLSILLSPAKISPLKHFQLRLRRRILPRLAKARRHQRPAGRAVNQPGPGNGSGPNAAKPIPP